MAKERISGYKPHRKGKVPSERTGSLYTGDYSSVELSAMDRFNNQFIDDRDTTRKQKLGRKMGNPIQMALMLARSPATIGHAVVNAPRMFANSARAGYHALAGNDFDYRGAAKDAKKSGEEAFHGKTPGENTIPNVLEAYTTDMPGQLFNLMDYGKEKYNEFYKRLFGTSGSIPPGPKPDRR